jgi:DNA-directed RNA polymerase alpha subunit
MKQFVLYQLETTDAYQAGMNPLTDMNEAELTLHDVQALQIALFAKLKTLLLNPTQEWELSTRAITTLKRENLLTVFALREVSPTAIIRFKSCGHMTIQELCREAVNHQCRLLNWERALNLLYSSRKR